jgi:hypothetical protein
MAGLYVLNSAYKPIVTFKFYDVYPVSLSGLDFDVSIQDVDNLMATATFSYTHYEVVKEDLY